MESTMTNAQELISIISMIGIIVFGLGLVWTYVKWFPATKRTRICKKIKGQFSYYRSEVYRPIFGWTAFNDNKYDGVIWQDKSWTNNKGECQENIDTFLKLKYSVAENETE